MKINGPDLFFKQNRSPSKTFARLPLRFFVNASAFWTIFLFLYGPSTSSAQEGGATEPAIYNTWSMMDENAKRQFLAGYLYGFRDARALGEVAVEFIKSSPPDPISGLRGILPHYQLTPLSSNDLVPLLNEYFREPKNRNDGLRVAIGKITGK
jgi:hypothetical protein